MKIKTCIASSFLLGLTAATGFGQAAAIDTNAPPKSPPWDTSASLGVTYTRGNSKTMLAVADIKANKKWGQNELHLGADFTYGENNSQKNADAQHAFAQYNRLFNERLFGYLRVDGLRDTVASIDYRLTVSPGLGYYFIKAKDATLSGEVGPGYIYEQDKHGHHSYATVRFAERYDQKLNDKVKLWQSVEYLPQVDDWARNYIVNAEAGIETALTKKLSQRTYVQDTYHSLPAKGRERNDFKLVVALAYKF